ncbi:hypothetical protein NFX39_01095 [Fructobacillus sp. W13]|uniref:O-antigen polymerase n=1 Tax=Fructobacillus apis TaxID=2935017 RepID=A0ABT0ZP10_9LACO|nr:hypothetical protein [Fructobacillus apis]MCO0831690.1 hypothetical protein [Fructobacillus apis]
MVNFLLPITFFSKNYTSSVAETTAMIAFPFFVAVILIQLFRFPTRIKDIIPSKLALGLGSFFWAVQLFAMAYSYGKTGDTVLTSGLLHSVIMLASWTITVYVAWAVIQLTVTNESEEKSFLKSGLIALAVYFVFVIFPQLVATLTHMKSIEGYVNHLAGLFERHWRVHGESYDFYKKGSYAVTQGRVNGFEPEAAFLANFIGVVFLPALIGVLSSGAKIWDKVKSANTEKMLNVILVAIIFGTLLLAKTTTGILTAVVAYVLWIVWSKGKSRVTLIVLMLAGIVLLGIAYLKVHAVQHLLNQFLFAKGGTDNRLGGTIGLFLTFLTHPIQGVGYGFTSFFTLQNVPEFTTHNFEFEHIYSQFGYPNLSDLLGWFASFGVIVMIPAMWLLLRLVARTNLMKHRLNTSLMDDSQLAWNRGMLTAFITMIVLAAFSSIFVIQVFLWPYLLMFFFYRKHVLRLEKELS